MIGHDVTDATVLVVAVDCGNSFSRLAPIRFARMPLTNVADYLEDDIWLARHYGFSRNDVTELEHANFLDDLEVDRLYDQLREQMCEWFSEVDETAASRFGLTG